MLKGGRGSRLAYTVRRKRGEKEKKIVAKKRGEKEKKIVAKKRGHVVCFKDNLPLGEIYIEEYQGYL